jgi:hypothetical protein
MSEIKQLTNKQIKIKDYQVLGTMKVNIHNKFQLFICWVFGISPSINYRYNISIKYYGSNKLFPKDVITDSIGNIYNVLHENNRVARIFNYTPLKSRPNLFGVMQIQGREIQNKK